MSKVRLKKICITGFRSFHKRTVIEFGENTVFIGSNNAGKTAALAALAKIFSHRRSERQIVRSDFHLPKDKSPEQVDGPLEMSIECVFEFDELVEGGAKSAVNEEGNNETESIGVPIFFDGLTVNAPDCIPILRVRLEATWIRSASDEGAIDSSIWFVTSSENVSKEDERKTQAPRQRLDAIRMIYIPATRDPGVEIKYAAGSAMSSMLSSIKWDSEKRERVTEDVKKLSNLLLEDPGALSVSNSIEDVWKSYNKDDKDAKASLAFIAGDFESIVKNPSILLTPSVLERPYQVDELGDGYKSLFYLTMIHSLLVLESKIRAKDTEVANHFEVSLPALTIVAIEEPENHIAPHLLGHLVNCLEGLWKDNACQVIITSHSPAIVGRIDPLAIRHFRLDRRTASTVCRALTLPNSLDDAYKYVKASLMAYPEVLFAKAVVLGEGDSEAVVLPKLLEVKLGRPDSLGVSIAPIGGRHAKHFWRLLKDLRIPHVTLLDFDRERNGGDQKRLKDALNWLQYVGEITQGKAEELAKKDIEEQQEYLETQNVFYSTPLDLDFAMLEAFPDEYKGTAEFGPQLDDGMLLRDFEKPETFDATNTEYGQRIQSAIKAVLHRCGGDGSTYTEEQRQLMPWYQNLFLGGRGKPATHMRALIEIGDEQLKEQAPKSLMRLVTALAKLLDA